MIQTDNLTKVYDGFKAVSNLSLSIEKGEIYGFIGLNGAGKTTLIRMLLGMIKPTSGHSIICGTKVTSNSPNLWSKIGYMVEGPSFYPELTVFENLELTRRVKLINNKDSVINIIDRLQLTSYKNRKAKNLSLGNAQRLGLAKALIHKPEIVILDEPTNALDPEGIVEIRKLLISLADDGVTILVSSHILEEVSKFASKIGIIHKGYLIKEVKSQELENSLDLKLIIGCGNNEAALDLLLENGIKAILNKEKQVETINKEAIQSPALVTELLVNAGNSPYLIKQEKEDLESYFLRTINL